MKIDELIKRSFYDKYSTDVAIVLDKKKEIQVVGIEEGKAYIFLKSFNKNFENNALIDLYKCKSGNFFLDLVYCYAKYRGNGLATNLDKIAVEFLKRRSCPTVLGYYMPMQLDRDKTSNETIPDKQLYINSRGFYKKNGYTIVSYDEYLLYPEKYPFISKGMFMEEIFIPTLVTKPILKDPKINVPDMTIMESFEEINGVMVANNVPNKIKDKIDEMVY